MQLLAFLACVIGFASVVGVWSIWRRSVVSRRVEDVTMRGLRDLGDLLPWDEGPIEPLDDVDLVDPDSVDPPSWKGFGATVQSVRRETA